MHRSRAASTASTASTADRAATAMLWGCELNQEKRTWTFKPQKEGKQDCKVLLSTICLGEKAKEEINLVEILPPASQEDKRPKPITIASLQASVLPTVMMGLELSPPVTFQLRAGSGPVFLSGQECHDDTLEEEEEEEEEEEQPEEEEDEEEDEDEDEDADLSLEETPVRPGKRLMPQKQTSVTKKKKVEKEEEVMRSSLKDKSLASKAKATPRAKKPTFKK